MENTVNATLNKVPKITLYFWIIKILCTTVGETIADYLNTQLTSVLQVQLWFGTTTVVFALILAAVFAIWSRVEKTLSIHKIDTKRR